MLAGSKDGDIYVVKYRPNGIARLDAAMGQPVHH